MPDNVLRVIMKIGEFEIEVVRKNIKHLILHVRRDGSISLSVPLRASDAEIGGFVAGRKEWIRKSLLRMASLAPVMEMPRWTPQEALVQFRRLKSLLKLLLDRWSKTMGMEYRGFRIKAMKSKWGSCNVRTHVLTFNLYLVQWPEECIEYVVVHELAHLSVPNHSADFYAVLDYYYPRWKECRRTMRGR